KRRKRYEETHKVIDEIDHKYCKQCDKWIPSDVGFYKKKTNLTDGLDTYCKECIKSRSMKWKGDNGESVKKHNDKYNSTNKRKASFKKFNDKQETKDKRLKWRKKNADKLKEYRIKRFKDKKHEISNSEWLYCKEYFDNSCAYCGLHVDNHYVTYKGEYKLTDLHKEHVDHEGSNDISNCVPSCKSCNSKK